MIDIILITILILAAAVAFHLQARHDIRIRREERQRERIESLKDECATLRTIDLIGEEAYDRMTEQIGKVLKRHESHCCTIVNLTCGPDSREGSEELHSLLPGVELNLVACSQEGLDCIDIYHNGARIGRLLLDDADQLFDIMKSSRITGTYVAEQNCYGIETSHQMCIIVFYKPAEKPANILKELKEAARRYAQKCATVTNICQN